MFNTDTINIITRLVDSFLDRNDYKLDSNKESVTQAGLLFNLKLEVEDYENRKVKSASIRFIFTGNTHVFYSVDDKAFVNWDEIDYDKWINSSNHDSCWRSDGFQYILSNLYFKMCKEVNDQVAPITLQSKAELGYGFGSLFEKIYVEVTRDHSKEGYRYKIIDISKSMFNHTK